MDISFVLIPTPSTTRSSWRGAYRPARQPKRRGAGAPRPSSSSRQQVSSALICCQAGLLTPPSRTPAYVGPLATELSAGDRFRAPEQVALSELDPKPPQGGRIVFRLHALGDEMAAAPECEVNKTGHKRLA
jgi:hypothetical protein